MNLTIQKEDGSGRLEPFSTIMDLVAKHGKYAVIEDLASLAQFDSEDEEGWWRERVQDARLSLELNQLLERMAQFERSLLMQEPEEKLGSKGGF